MLPAASPASPAGVANSGYWGIPVKPETRYRASFYARAAPDFNGPVSVAIESADGATVYARATVPHLTGDWKQYTVTLRTGKVAPTSNARLALTVDRPGTVWLGLVSLFPPTWKNRPNGFRPDLMQMLVDLKPAFLRFPGGNYLEGNTIATRFDWKKTLGPLTQRPGHPGPWGYRSTDGMGLLEFLLWCEDMGAEPVLAVYAGYSLRGEYVKPGPDLEPYIQDALDEIEYVTGSATTKWGAQRAKDGHPAPFKLQYVEVGNEDFFDRSGSYDARFAQFYDAIKAKYPALKVISTVGNEQPAAKRVHSRQPDVLDEHYYRTTDSFLQMSPAHYENYDRKGPEIFVGEWAAHEEIAPWDPRSRSLAADTEHESRAGRCRVDDGNGAERRPDHDAVLCAASGQREPGRRGSGDRTSSATMRCRSFGSPSYYALQMFSRNHGDTILKTTMTGAPLLSSVTRDSKTGAIIIKHVNPQATPQTVRIELKGIRSVAPTATVILLAADPAATNAIDEPTKVVPVTRRVQRHRPFVHLYLPALFDHCPATWTRSEERSREISGEENEEV